MKLLQTIKNYFVSKYEDNSPSQRAELLALCVTTFVWLIVLIGGCFFNFTNKAPEYKEIRITLSDSLPTQSVKAQESLAPKTPTQENSTAQESVAKAESAPAERPQPQVAQPTQATQPAAVTPKPAATAAKVPSKTPTPAPVAEEPKYTISKPQTYAKSVEELMAEQQSSQRKSQWDDSAFAESSSFVSETSTSSVPVSQQALSSSNALVGSAGSSASAQQSSVASTSTNRSSSSSSAGEVSSSTSSQLAAVSSAKPTNYSSNSGSGVSSTAQVSTVSSGSGVSIAMDNGSMRKLLEPSEPRITISEENAALIDSSKTVSITFRVLPDGSVPLTGIQIMPAASLPTAVQSEIKAQIARWRFASDASEGHAKFSYDIIKK